MVNYHRTEDSAVFCLKVDKYGSRIDAQVISNGINVGEEMIKRGLAVPYTGSGQKQNWCL